MSFFVSKDLVGRVLETDLIDSDEDSTFISYLSINNQIIEILSYNFKESTLELKIENDVSFKTIHDLVGEKAVIKTFGTKIKALNVSDLNLLNFTNVDNNYIKIKIKIIDSNKEESHD